MRTVLLAVLLTGCATDYGRIGKPEVDWNAKTPTEVAAAVSVDYDPRFDSWPTFEGPISTNGNGKVALRGIGGTDPEEMLHQVYIRATARDWRYIQNIDVEGGETSMFVKIDSDVARCGTYGCQIREAVGAMVSWDYLRSRLNTGFSARAGAQQGSDVVVFLGPNYIEGYLQAIRGYEGDVESASDNGSRSGGG